MAAHAVRLSAGVLSASGVLTGAAASSVDLRGVPEPSYRPSSTSCEYFRGSAGHPAPFVFYNLHNGSVDVVPPTTHASGVCIFPAASCVESLGVAGFSCCTRTPGSQRTAVLGLSPSTLNLVTCLLVLVLPAHMHRLCKSRSKSQEPSSPEIKQLPCLVQLIFFATVTIDCWLMITAATMTQTALAVPVRNAMLAAGVFLTPVQEIFQFLEDVVTVKVNAAVGARDMTAVRDVLVMGVLGGLASGILAAGCVSLLCLNRGILRALLAPFSLNEEWSNSLSGCGLVPHADEVVDLALPFVLLSAWTWPFRFVNMALTGFLMSIGFWRMFFVLVVIERGLVVVGLYALFLPQPSLVVLGWISFAASCVGTLSTGACLLSQRTVRELFAAADCDSPASGDASPVLHSAASSGLRSSSGRRLMGSVVREGLVAMVADLCVQLPLTVGVYTAGVHLGLGAMYQISALQAAFPQYGIAWVQGLAIAFRILGSSMLGSGDFAGFRAFFVVCIVYVGMLTVVSLLTTLPFADNISFGLAEQGCEYASSSSCVHIYTSIFGGGADAGDTLQGSSFAAFVPALCAVCFYRTFKAGLYACQDFRFMALSGAGTLLLVFLPAFAVALRLRGPTSLFLAMYSPCLVLALVFAARICRNVQRMGVGQIAAAPSDSETSASSSDASDSG